MKKTLKDVVEFYKWMWNCQFNKFGKCIFFPLFILASPIIFIIALGMKIDD